MLQLLHVDLDEGSWMALGPIRRKAMDYEWRYMNQESTRKVGYLRVEDQKNGNKWETLGTRKSHEGEKSRVA